MAVESTKYIPSETKQIMHAQLSRIWPDNQVLVLDPSIRLKLFEEK